MMIAYFLFILGIGGFLGYGLATMAFSPKDTKKIILYSPWIGIALIVLLSTNLGIGKVPMQLHTFIILFVGAILVFYAMVTQGLGLSGRKEQWTLSVTSIIFAALTFAGSTLLTPNFVNQTPLHFFSQDPTKSSVDFSYQLPNKAVFENTISPLPFLIQFFSFFHLDELVFQKVLLISIVFLTALVIDSVCETFVPNIWIRRLTAFSLSFGSSLILTQAHISFTFIFGLYVAFIYCVLAWMQIDLNAKMIQLVFALFLSTLVMCSLWFALCAIGIHAYMLYRNKKFQDVRAFISILVIFCILNPFLISSALKP